MRACFPAPALLLAALFLPALAGLVRADNVSAASYNHCTIYNASACPGANVTAKAVTTTERDAASKPVWSAQAGKGLAAFAIDLSNTCRWVDGANGNTTDVFVPFKTDQEWAAFVTAAGTSGSASAKYVALVHCARPGVVGIPPNDPAGGELTTNLCYTQSGVLQTAAQAQPFTVTAYGRENESRSETPASMIFSCYTQAGYGPWNKTVVSAMLKGLNADRVGGSSASSANSDWEVTNVTYSGAPPPPVDGICGSTVNGQTLASAPSGGELCNSGVPTSVSGSGPWTWSCQGINGGNDSATCTAEHTAPTCPAAIATGTPLAAGNILLNYPGIGGALVSETSRGYVGGTFVVSYFNGICSLSYSGGVWDAWVLCIATEYAREDLPGYANCTPSFVTDMAGSPLKVNLVGGDAVMNSATPTDFDLTLKDGRTLEGHVKGGLNPDEGWLMVRRSAAPLVFENGALNADDWFGDRDHRSLNGYTDLAETFKDFVIKDEFGQRFVPLHSLTNDEKKTKALAKGDGAITDPSLDLRVIDAAGAEHLASDYFDRIYVDYRNVVEGDGPDGKSGNNLILERGMVRTLAGENHGAVDQWFILDLPADYGPVDHPTKSKVLPAAR